MRNLIGICVLVWSLTGVAQNFKSDLSKISQSYDAHKKLSMNITYKVFKDKKSQKADNINYGFYRRNNSSYSNKLDRIESLVTENFTIFIDSVGKTITYSGTGSKKPISTFDPSGIEEMVKNSKKIETIPANKQTLAYRIWMNEFNDGEVEYYEIYFDPKTYLMKQMTLVYNKKIDFGDGFQKEVSSPKVEIVFSNIDPDPKYSSDQFSLDGYLVRSGKSYKPTGKFKNYKINIL